jgi:UDP-glucose 4-epimerase
MNIFVTGGTGFIGSYVVDNLVKKGHHITILARNPEKIEEFINHPRINFVKGSITDYEIIAKSLIGIDIFILCALGWGESASLMLLRDTTPSVTLIDLAIRSGVKKILYTSSTAAVGDLRSVMDENSRSLPNSFYGASKAATECFILAQGAVHNIHCNIIRPSYTFGNPVVRGAPMQVDRRIFDIVKMAKAGETVNLIKNDGTQFIWAGDLTLFYEHIIVSDYNRSIFFGVGSNFITWEDITKFAIEYTGSNSRIELEDLGWIKGSRWYDDTKIRDFLKCDVTSFDRIMDHIRYIADTM